MALLDGLAVPTLPEGWQVCARGTESYRITGKNKHGGNTLLITARRLIESDGKLWKKIIVSVLDLATTPTYADVQCAREICVRPDEHTYMVWPSREEGLAGALNCLYLYVPIGHRPLPDFRPDPRRNRL